MAFTELLNEFVFNDPIDLTIELERIVLNGANSMLPHLQRLLF